MRIPIIFQAWSRPRRLLLAIIAVCCLTTTLVACSSGSPSDKSATGEVELTYGLWDSAQQPAMQKIIDEFEQENPHIKVRITLTPWDSYWTKLQTAATGGSAPDVFWMMNDRLKLYASGGALLPIDDQIAKDNVDLSGFVASSTDSIKWDDHVYGLPKDTNSFGLFYNKKLFADAGVQPPDESWTWQDLITAAEKLTDPDQGIYGVGAPVADVLGYYLTIPQAGGYVISPDGTKSGYDDPKTIEGLQYWVDLINKYHVSPTVQQLTDQDAMTMFTSGKIAMYYGGSWDPVAIAAVPEAAQNTGIAPLPKNVDRSFYANGIANVIFAKTEHPKEAWEFLKFLGSERAADIQAETGTVIPALKGREAAYVAAFPQFDMQVLIDQLPNAKPIPSSLNTAVWSDMAVQEFTKAWSGSQSVQQSAQTVAQQMNDDLAKEHK